MSGVDYDGTPVVVEFPIWSVQGDSACTNVDILEDMILECSQHFTVAITDATLGTDFSGPQSSAVIYIYDNDGELK